jgi:tetratricopeptide repeat protein 21B
LFQALYYAGIFLLHVDRVDKAREYVDRLLKINPQSKDGLILKGWVEVSLDGQ